MRIYVYGVTGPNESRGNYFYKSLLSRVEFGENGDVRTFTNTRVYVAPSNTGYLDRQSSKFPCVGEGTISRGTFSVYRSLHVENTNFRKNRIYSENLCKKLRAVIGKWKTTTAYGTRNNAAGKSRIGRNAR